MDASPSPLERLRLALPGLPGRLQEAGRFITRNDFDATTRSMRDLAAAAGLQPASFTRLAQALGHTGWDDFRDALIEARRPAPAPFSARVQRGPEKASRGASGIAVEMIAIDADSVAHLDATPIAAAAKALHSARRIWIAGFRSCRSVAELLHYQLRLFRPDAVRLIGGAGPEDLDFGGFSAGDAVVVIGFAPYSRSSVLAAHAAREAECMIVALADTPAAPMAEGADHLLLFDAATTPGFFPSLTGAIASAQALAATVFTLGGEAAQSRLRQTETRLAALSQYVPTEQSR
ncbi:MAG: MurR/RpiR family transcriptional regulator [Alphaproteobacteria bacterium]|nr:MurR/RpiR family transcriptional regulator [Alphaproteobacteria bacterium]